MERQKAFVAPKESKSNKAAASETAVDVEALKRKFADREEKKAKKKAKKDDAKSFLV
jgi:hypothetical protein